MTAHGDHHQEPNGESTSIRELIIACSVLLVFTIACFSIMLAGML